MASLLEEGNEDVYKDLPYYNAILRSFFKKQILHLLEELASQTGEEAIILTANINNGTMSHLGTSTARGFIEGRDDIKSQFLSYCLTSHHSVSSVTSGSSFSSSTFPRNLYSSMCPPPKRQRLDTSMSSSSFTSAAASSSVVTPSHTDILESQTRAPVQKFFTSLNDSQSSITSDIVKKQHERKSVTNPEEVKKEFNKDTLDESIQQVAPQVGAEDSEVHVTDKSLDADGLLGCSGQTSNDRPRSGRGSPDVPVDGASDSSADGPVRDVFDGGSEAIIVKTEPLSDDLEDCEVMASWTQQDLPWPGPKPSMIANREPGTLPAMTVYPSSTYTRGRDEESYSPSSGTHQKPGNEDSADSCDNVKSFNSSVTMTTRSQSKLQKTDMVHSQKTGNKKYRSAKAREVHIQILKLAQSSRTDKPNMMDLEQTIIDEMFGDLLEQSDKGTSHDDQDGEGASCNVTDDKSDVVKLPECNVTDDKSDVVKLPECDVTDDKSDVVKLPEPVPRGEFRPVSLTTGEPTVIAIDVGTTEVQMRGCQCPQITQIVAEEISSGQTFNQFVLPKEPISPAAQLLADITMNNGTMVVHGTRVQTVSIRTGLDRLCNWLAAFSNVVLVAHNGKRYSFPVLVKAFENVNKLEQLFSSICGFIDSVAVYRRQYPERRSYKQTALAHDLLHTKFNVHNADRDVRVLGKLLSFTLSCLSPGDFMSFSFSPLSVYHALLFSEERGKNINSLNVLVANGICKFATAENIAGSGLNLEHLRQIFLRDGEGGLRDAFLFKNSEGQARVTYCTRVLETVIPKMAAYFQKK